MLHIEQNRSFTQEEVENYIYTKVGGKLLGKMDSINPRFVFIGDRKIHVDWVKCLVGKENWVVRIK